MTPALRVGATAVATALACALGAAAVFAALAGTWFLTAYDGLACLGWAAQAAQLFRSRVREMRGRRP